MCLIKWATIIFCLSRNYMPICIWTESLLHSEKVLLNKKYFVSDNDSQLSEEVTDFLG